jgi:hypothetical protein
MVHTYINTYIHTYIRGHTSMILLMFTPARIHDCIYACINIHTYIHIKGCCRHGSHIRAYSKALFISSTIMYKKTALRGSSTGCPAWFSCEIITGFIRGSQSFFTSLVCLSVSQHSCEIITGFIRDRQSFYTL